MAAKYLRYWHMENQFQHASSSIKIDYYLKLIVQVYYRKIYFGIIFKIIWTESNHIRNYESFEKREIHQPFFYFMSLAFVLYKVHSKLKSAFCLNEFFTL